MRPPAANSASLPLLDALEACLRDLLQELPPQSSPPRGPGAPPVLPACVLWAGLLVCVLRGFASQRRLWQLLCLKGLWHFPRVPLTYQAVCQRLARTPSTALVHCFDRLTLLLRQRYAAVRDLPYAPFAAEILALDPSKLDALLRKLKLLRSLRRSDPRLLPGQLATLFDLRRQLWQRVEFWEDAQRNEKHGVEHWLDRLLPGTLLLFDLGFFSFSWLDTLTQRDFYYVCRYRAKTSFQLYCTLYDGPAGPVHLRDRLVYLGAHRADRAAEPVRLIELFLANGTTFRYLTNVLDPKLLPARHVVELYRRRWDIEQAFNLLKTHLNLFLLWSGHPHVVLHQVFATLIIAQVVFALRTEVAREAGAELREVSLPLLLRWVPELAASGLDPVAVLAERGRQAGIIRPVRGRERLLPPEQVPGYLAPPERPPPRQPRYAGKQGTTSAAHAHRGTRKHGWGLRRRQPRTR